MSIAEDMAQLTVLTWYAQGLEYRRWVQGGRYEEAKYDSAHLPSQHTGTAGASQV